LRGIFSKFASKIPNAAGAASGAAGGAPKGGGAALTVLLGLTLGSYGLYHSMVTVQPGHKGIIYSRLRGLDEQAQLVEGLNFVLPWFQRAVVFDIRTRPQPIDTHSGSKDLQMVQISLRVLFKPDPNDLPWIYRRLGKDFDSRVLPSIVNEVTKAVVAQYNASELLTKRDLVSKQIREMLMKRAGDFKILLDDVAITHLAFSKEYTAAVEAKQVAQQDSERAKYIVERALQEKKSIVIKAEGEAQSAQLIGNAIQNNPAFIQLRRIEAAKEIASMVVSSSNKVYLNADSLMINTLGDSDLHEHVDTSAKGRKNGWGM
jgi:prohibitin 2